MPCDVEIREILEGLAPPLLVDRTRLGVPAQHLRHFEIPRSRALSIAVGSRGRVPR